MSNTRWLYPLPQGEGQGEGGRPEALHSKLWRLGALVLLCLTIFWSAPLQAQMVTVNPAEYPDALANPLMGFRDGFETSKPSNWKSKPYQRIYRHYIHWNLIENAQSDDVQKIKNYCNTMWAGCEAANVKIIPRVILQYGDNQYYFPSYLTNGDWTSLATRTAVTNMIRKLGEAWDSDPRVAWVQTGIIGKWGEQESPTGVDANVVAPDNAKWATIMGQSFATAFPNKKLVVRNLQYWTQPMGEYWDSFAHQGQYSGAWTAIKNANANGRYLVAPIEGETAYNWGTFPSYAGADPNATLSTPAYYNYIIDSIKQLHCSGLGWISGYTVGPATATGANLVQKAFGYRFLITEFNCSARTEPGSALALSAKVKNVGSAVMFENWPVAIVLVNESTRQIVHQSVISGTDIRTWTPGSNFDWDPKSNTNGSRVYLTPPVEKTINASIPIPANITPGQYLAGIAILEPVTQKPGVYFAVTNFFKQSQTQPLCRIGIGADATNHTLTGPFDSLVDSNDTRYYTLTPPTKYTITASAGPNGSISPSGSAQVNSGANQTFTITANSGYQVDVVAVDGAGQGSINSYTFTNVTTNHTISATFKTSGAAGDVSLVGSWVQGTNHAKEAGSNRALVVMLYGEGSGNISASSVTYGDQTMTKVVETAYLNSSYSYNGAFVLNESGVAAASSGTISVTWSMAPATGSDVTSAFFSNVKQSSLTGATASNGLVNATITTSPLANSAGDMVLVGGTAANNGTYTINNGFTRGIPETAASFGDITSAYKPGTGADETPSLTMSASMRQTMVAFVLKKSAAALVQYTLTTNAVNGTITLNPTGGVYTGGTVVTVTANPHSGYAFSGWSGDLSGSVSPTNITMNANQSVTANFSVQSISFLPPVLQDGQLKLVWGGGGTLQSATNVMGSWGDIPGAVSPYLSPATNAAQYFRVKQ